jgi:hypothetical protein
VKFLLGFPVLLLVALSFIGTLLSIAISMIIHNPIPVILWFGIWIIPAYVSERDKKRRLALMYSLRFNEKKWTSRLPQIEEKVND